MSGSLPLTHLPKKHVGQPSTATTASTTAMAYGDLWLLVATSRLHDNPVILMLIRNKRGWHSYSP